MPKIKKSELTKAEVKFYDLCKEKDWRVEVDEDNSPMLLPRRSTDHYRVFPYDMENASIVFLDKPGQRKQTVLKKMEKANILGEILQEGDHEFSATIPYERMPRAVKTLNLKRKKAHPGMSVEHMKKIRRMK